MSDENNALITNSFYLEGRIDATNHIERNNIVFENDIDKYMYYKGYVEIKANLDAEIDHYDMNLLWSDDIKQIYNLQYEIYKLR
jgi:hypothetical protein